MARTRWPSDLRTPASCTGQADQTGSAGGCQGLGPADKSISRQPERRRPIRRSGRDPGLRPYARTRPKPRKQGRKHNPHPPCRLGATDIPVELVVGVVPIIRLCGAQLSHGDDQDAGMRLRDASLSQISERRRWHFVIIGGANLVSAACRCPAVSAGSQCATGCMSGRQVSAGAGPRSAWRQQPLAIRSTGRPDEIPLKRPCRLPLEGWCRDNRD